MVPSGFMSGVYCLVSGRARGAHYLLLGSELEATKEFLDEMELSSAKGLENSFGTGANRRRMCSHGTFAIDLLLLLEVMLGLKSLGPVWIRVIYKMEPSITPCS